jgi:indolepyruvate ferredoxin oxidoreductase beta subunit
MEKEEILNIIVSGVGGQGNVLASLILASSAVKDDFYVSVGETYGAAQRGGSVTSHVRISKKREYGPLIPKGNAHIVVGFEPTECLRALGEFGNEKTKVFVNPKPVYSIDVLSGGAEYPSVEKVINAMKELVSSVYVINATELAKKAGNPVMQNLVMIGALAGSGLIPIKTESFRESIIEIFPGEKGRANQKAFELGAKAISKN